MDTILNVEDTCRSLILPSYWLPVLSSLSESIVLCHNYAPSRWGIRLDRTGIMLKIGMHEVFQITQNTRPVHLIVDRHTVPEDLRKLPAIEFTGERSWDGNARADGYYASNPGSEACNLEFDQLAQFYGIIAIAHEEVIRRAGKTRMHPSTRKTHCPELVAFIAKEVGRCLPEPHYQTPSQLDR